MLDGLAYECEHVNNKKTIFQNNIGAGLIQDIKQCNVRAGHSEPMASLQLWALVGGC